MTSHLSNEARKKLTPLLCSVARLLAQGMQLDELHLQTLLLGAGLESDQLALDELKTWYRLLAQALEHPSETGRRVAAEALLMRGLPKATVLKALGILGESCHAETATTGPKANPILAQRGTFMVPEQGEQGLESELSARQFGGDLWAVPVHERHAFVSGGGQGALFDLSTRRAQWTIVIDSVSDGMAFSQEATLVAVAAQGVVYLWDIGTGEISRTLRCPSDGIMAFSPDGRVLQTYSNSDKAVHLWDVSSGHELLRLDEERGGSWKRVSFSPDGRLVASSSQRHQNVRLLEIATGDELWSLDGHRDACFSPDGLLLATEPWRYDDTADVYLWDVIEYSELRRLKTERGGDAFYAFSPDSRTLATVTGYSAHIFQLWDVRTGRQLQRSAWKHGNRFILTAFSPDGRYLAHQARSGHGDDTLWTLWLRDMTTGQQLKLPESWYPKWGGFSSDGRTVLAVCSMDNLPAPIQLGIGLWDTATGYLLSKLCPNA